MSLDHGSGGGFGISWGKKSGGGGSSRPVTDGELKLAGLVLAAFALVSAGLSNVTRHSFEADVMGTYTRNDSRITSEGANLSFSYRAVVRNAGEGGGQMLLRNEPDLFAGKFYVVPTLIQNRLEDSAGMRCSFEANGWNFYPFRKNILGVTDCRPITPPNPAGS